VRPDELRTTVEIALHKHRADKHVREREKWFSTTLRSIADGIITVDANNRVTYMNPAAEALTGSTHEHAAGRSSSEVLLLLDNAEQPLSPTPFERALRDRETVNLPDAIVRQGSTGTLRHIGDSAAPVTEHDQLLGAVMVFRDTTEQRELQQQLLASDRMASVGLLAAGVAHEINNPLGAALMSLELATASVESLSKHRCSMSITGRITCIRTPFPTSRKNSESRSTTISTIPPRLLRPSCWPARPDMT
jgi:PAS domain S-box-containing protein